MKFISDQDGHVFRSGLHFHTTPSTLSTRIILRVVRILLNGVARLKFLGRVDLERIAIYSTEQLLNLPGKLPFCPTKATETDRVQELLERLKPRAIQQELIRLGPPGDGGYFVPDDLVGIEACFSPGVGNVAGFEKDCAERGMKVFMADGSVAAPPETHAQFSFIRKFISSLSQGNSITLFDWVHASLPDSQSDLLLQIDIEGHEYETILSTPTNLLQRFRIIVIEFHNLDLLFSEPIFALYERAFAKILSTHTCVHLQSNIISDSITVRGTKFPHLAEFTFLRDDRISGPTS